MAIDHIVFPKILTKELIDEILVIYDNSRLSDEWRLLSEKLGQDHLDQIFVSIKQRDERKANEIWSKLNQEEKDKRIRGSQAIYFNRWSEGSSLKDTFSNINIRDISYSENKNQNHTDQYSIACWNHQALYQNKYEFFSGDESPFAMCYLSEIVIKDRKFISAYHFVMYSKAEIFIDRKSMNSIYNAQSVREILNAERKIEFFDKKVWERSVGEIVRMSIRQKFAQNEKALKLLESTKRTLIICVDKSDFWGVGMNTQNEYKVGYNMLGNLLTELRIELYGS